MSRGALGTVESTEESGSHGGKDVVRKRSPLPVSFLLFLIWLYRVCVGVRLPPCCRFTPSCSEYAVRALKIHGFLKGSALAVWRVVRCNPFCRGGYDPVPPKKTRERV